MQMYDCVVRIRGEVGETVPKFGLTASEIALLRVIHGDDAVVEIEPSGAAGIEPGEEYDRLVTIYGRKAENMKAITDLFGLKANPRMIAQLDLPTPEPAEKKKAKAA